MSLSPPRPACESSFLERDLPSSAPAPVLIVLNYSLPRLTARLWRRGKREEVFVWMCERRRGTGRQREIKACWHQPSAQPTSSTHPPTACLTICADGGANRLFDAAPGWLPDETPNAAREAFAPSTIVGDLDSLAPATRAFYESIGVSIVDQASDRDSTDLQKCLAFAASRAPPSAPRVALGALGGRLDHTLAAINLLYARDHGNSLILAGDGCLARAVPAGATTLHPARGVEGPGCGLLALSPTSVAVTTTGLAWNLGGGEGEARALMLGGGQSTSNRVVGESVTIHAGAPLLWTTELVREDA